MKFRELSDEEWRFVEPFLPPRAKTGRPRADDRKTINGIFHQPRFNLLNKFFCEATGKRSVGIDNQLHRSLHSHL